jgi:hypothetical protein
MSHQITMKKNLIILIIISLSLISHDFVLAQSSSEKIVIAEAERISQDKFPIKTKTPKGAKVFAVNKPKKDVLKAIDKGLNELFAIAKKNKYSAKLNYSDYTIFIAKPDRDKDFEGKYSPDIAINASQYRETIYDKGGFIYVAGIVVAFNPCVFMIGEHSNNFQRISELVRYEGEHLVLYHNDQKRFLETQDHSKGGGHPILQ